MKLTSRSKILLPTKCFFRTVKGKYGGGEVDYPFPWRYFDEETQQVEQVELGPWDCAMLVPLTAEQCCDMVKSSVPALDVNGRHIECYFEEPEVADEDKVILVWDASTGTVSCLLRRLYNCIFFTIVRHLIVSTRLLPFKLLRFLNYLFVHKIVDDAIPHTPTLEETDVE